jgi:hypothetical protein
MIQLAFEIYGGSKDVCSFPIGAFYLAASHRQIKNGFFVPFATLR